MKTFQEYLNEIKTEPNLIEEVKKLRTKERQKNKNDDYSLGTIEGLSVAIDCIKENKNLTGKPLILELRKTININVSPLSVADWESVFKQSGFSSVESTNGEMTLMSLKGMIKDEGLLNTLNIIKNGHKRENKEMFQNMHIFFTKTGKELKYIAVCSQK